MRAFPKYNGALALDDAQSHFKRPTLWLYERQRFVGFAYIIHSRFHYILFLAVNDQLRSRVRQSDYHRTAEAIPQGLLVLDVEQPNPKRKTTTNGYAALPSTGETVSTPLPKRLRKAR